MFRPAPKPYELMSQDDALDYCHQRFSCYTAPLRRTVVYFQRRYDRRRILGLAHDASWQQGKQAFRHHVQVTDRANRAAVGVSYMLGVENKPVALCHIVAAAGDTQTLMQMISAHREVTTVQGPAQCTVLYLAARSGYVDMLTALLRSNVGLKVNDIQEQGSTPLHVAAFYGHVDVVKLLLECGADPTIKNRYGNVPKDETKSPEIIALLDRRTDQVATLCQSLVKAEAISPFVKIEFAGEPVGFLAKRPCSHNVIEAFAGSHTTAFHGTKMQHVGSILKVGLKPSGTTLKDGSKVTPPAGHFSLDKKYAGVDDWARAIFVTPNVTYAAHPAYAEQIVDSESKRYRVVIVAMVADGSYERYTSTVSSYTPMAGESATPESRIEVPRRIEMPGDEPSDTEHRLPGENPCGEILRAECEQAVVVVGVLLLRQSFIDCIPAGMTADKFHNLLK